MNINLQFSYLALHKNYCECDYDLSNFTEFKIKDEYCKILYPTYFIKDVILENPEVCMTKLPLDFKDINIELKDIEIYEYMYDEKEKEEEEMRYKKESISSEKESILDNSYQKKYLKYKKKYLELKK